MDLATAATRIDREEDVWLEPLRKAVEYARDAGGKARHEELSEIWRREVEERRKFRMGLAVSFNEASSSWDHLKKRIEQRLERYEASWSEVKAANAKARRSAVVFTVVGPLAVLALTRAQGPSLEFGAAAGLLTAGLIMTAADMLWPEVRGYRLKGWRDGQYRAMILGSQKTMSQMHSHGTYWADSADRDALLSKADRALERRPEGAPRYMNYDKLNIGLVIAGIAGCIFFSLVR